MEIQRSICRAAAVVAVAAMLVLTGWTRGAMAAPPGDDWSPKPPGGAVVITVIGVVSPGVESGCRLLAPLSNSGGSAYLLLGAGTDTPEGVPVRVTGQLRPDLLTTCQQGTPLVASSITPL